MSDVSSINDPFEDFNVESGSEKEFLVEALKHGDIQEEDVLAFQRARDSTTYFLGLLQHRDTTLFQEHSMNDPKPLTISNGTTAKLFSEVTELSKGRPRNKVRPRRDFELNTPRHVPYPILQSQAELYARSNTSTAQIDCGQTASPWHQFTAKVYHYARKKGMGRHRAKTEAMRAKAAYQHHLGLPKGYQLDESDEHPTVKPDVYVAMKSIASMIVDLPCGPIKPVALTADCDEGGDQIKNHMKISQHIVNAKDVETSHGRGVETLSEALEGEQLRPHNRKKKWGKIKSREKSRAKAHSKGFPIVATASPARHRASKDQRPTDAGQVGINFKAKPTLGRSSLLTATEGSTVSENRIKDQYQRSRTCDAVGDEPSSYITSEWVSINEEQPRPQKGKRDARKRKRDELKLETKNVEDLLIPKKSCNRPQTQLLNVLVSRDASSRESNQTTAKAGREERQMKIEPQTQSGTRDHEDHNDDFPANQRPRNRRRHRNKISKPVNVPSSAMSSLMKSEECPNIFHMGEGFRTSTGSEWRMHMSGEGCLQGKDPPQLNREKMSLIEDRNVIQTMVMEQLRKELGAAIPETSKEYDEETKEPNMLEIGPRRGIPGLEQNGGNTRIIEDLEATKLSKRRSPDERKKKETKTKISVSPSAVTEGLKILPLVGSKRLSSGKLSGGIQHKTQKDTREKATINIGMSLAEPQDGKEVSETICETVIYPASKAERSVGVAGSEAKAKPRSSESSPSTGDRTISEKCSESQISMSEYGSLDHCVPEFNVIKVESKMTRPPFQSTSSITAENCPNIKERTGFPTLEPSAYQKGEHPDPTPAEHKQVAAQTPKKSVKHPTKSPFFSHTEFLEKSKVAREIKPRSRGGTRSCIPFPPLSASSFGLLQERLAHDPFRLLIGVTFLNRTAGKHAIPVFFELMRRYPTPVDILAADKEDIITLTRHLGLQAIRAKAYIKYADLWMNNPPVKGRRYRVENYPNPGDGKDIKKCEVLDDDDPRTGAWEIGHMTKGRYAIDSWRIFCRDILRGDAQGWNGEGCRDDGFQPEWMRVQPRDKELIAYLRWMWLKEGFEWNPVTNEKEVASRDLLKAAMAGRIEWDDGGEARILDEANDDKTVSKLTATAEREGQPFRVSS
jgi:methyl-CpG-binding domain protein 4